MTDATTLLALAERAGAITSGDVYCGERCGFGCKRAAFDQATAEADALARSLGPGWTAAVWDNLGWHYRAFRGAAEIVPRIEKGGSSSTGGWRVSGYSAWINLQFEGKFFQFIEYAETAEDALGFATQKARTAVLAMTAQLNAISSDEPAALRAQAGEGE